MGPEMTLCKHFSDTQDLNRNQMLAVPHTTRVMVGGKHLSVKLDGWKDARLFAALGALTPASPYTCLLGSKGGKTGRMPPAAG